jgi:hypothetical protein
MATTQKDVYLRFVLNQQEYQRVKAGIEGITNLTRRLNGVMGALGVGLSVGGFAAFIKSSANAVSQQRALAESVGLTVEELSSLNYAAVQNETTQEALGKAIFRINELLKEGAEAGSKAAGILGRYGITSEQIREGTVGTSEALRIIADRFNSLPNGIEKSALAAELLGTKLGRQLIPFLNLGSKGFEEFARQGEAVGAIMTDKVADAVAKANDKLSALYQTIQTQVLVGLAAFFGLVEANAGDGQIEKLTGQISALEGELRLLAQFANKTETGGILGKIFHVGDAARIAEINNHLVGLRKELEKLKKEQMEGIVAGGQPKGRDKVTPPADPNAAGKRLEAERKEREQLLDSYDKEGQALAKLSADQQKLHELAVAGKISWEQYSRAIEGVGEAYVELGSEDIAEATDALDEFGKQAARNMQDIVAGFLRGEQSGKSFFESLISGLADLAAELAAQALLRELFGALAGSANPFLAGIGTFFGGVKAAGGGMISGPGGPTDDRVPALLSDGEYVIQASAVSRWGKNFLDFVNSGMPVRDAGVRVAYATGGIVGAVSHAKSGAQGAVVQIINNGAPVKVDSQESGVAPDGRAIERIVISAIERDAASGGPGIRAIQRATGTRRQGRTT